MINIKLLKVIRKKTSISIVECKRALEKNNWNYYKTLEWIKKNDFIKKNISNFYKLEKEKILVNKNRNKECVTILKTENEFVFNGNIFFNHAIEIINNTKIYEENNIIKYIKNSYFKSIFFNNLIKKYTDISKDEIILKELNIIKLKKGEIKIYIHKKCCINIGIDGGSIFFSQSNLLGIKILMNIFAANSVSFDIIGLCKSIVCTERNFLYNKYQRVKKTKLETEILIRKNILILLKKIVLLERCCIIENKKIGKMIKKVQGILFCYHKYSK